VPRCDPADDPRTFILELHQSALYDDLASGEQFMTTTEIISLIRALPYGERAAILEAIQTPVPSPTPTSAPESTPKPSFDFEAEAAAIRKRILEAKPIPYEEMTQEMRDAIDMALKKRQKSRPIEEFIADIRAGVYASEGL
jgi:hypothetical protein